MPFHEPGLAELLDLSANRMVLTEDFSERVVNADVVFIAAGTPKFTHWGSRSLLRRIHRRTSPAATCRITSRFEGIGISKVGIGN